jgi:hypothetical protein
MSTLFTAQPGRQGKAPRARWSKVQAEVDGIVYEGQLHIPDGLRRVSDVLSDERPFLNLIEVSVNGKPQRERYIAINKRHIRTLRVLDDGELPGGIDRW